MYKIGIGFDIHQLKDDHVLKIGGVEIPHSKGLFGHSDADVLVHAVMDSILGALALGDIGQHFPDTSSKYKNANSLELLYQVHELAKNKGYFVSNLDCIVIAEKPKISTYISKMRENLAIKLETNSPDYNVTKVQFGQDLYVTHVTVLGNQIVLSCAANGLSLYDLINKDDIQPRGIHNIGYVYHAEFHNNYLFAASREGLQIFQID